VGIDVSPGQVARARELHDMLGLDTELLVAPLSRDALGGREFERLAGRYVLHHLDPPTIANDAAALLQHGGTAAFVETMGLNPLLRLARRHLPGRFGIPRHGSPDERPLTRADLAALKGAFGELRCEVAELTFFRIFDRQVLRHRWRATSTALAAFDDALNRLGLGRWSYHQVVVLRKVR
jgi:hypothetical protein